jgi:large subunit ribosomal protein L14
MIQQQTVLHVSDNSGGRKVKCIKVLGGFQRKVAKLGDVIVVSIKQLRNVNRDRSKVKKKEVYKALIIRTKTGFKKKNGFRWKFSDNAVILINKQYNPMGTRVLGAIPKILKTKIYQKMLNLSHSVAI